MSNIPNIDSEMARALRESEARVVGLEPCTEGIHPMSAVRERYLFGRRYWNHDAPELHEVVNECVITPERNIPVRLYRPNDNPRLPVLIYAHGGGFVVGNLDSHDKICRLLALGSEAAVLAVDYALAPEYKFPRPLVEVQAVIDALPGFSDRFNLDIDRLALGGDSAGASISLGVALALRDEAPKTFACLKALLLFYGNFGLGTNCESARLFGTPEYGLDLDKMAFYRASYVANEADHDNPRLNQLAADLTGMPRMLILAAGLDPLLDNADALAKRCEVFSVPHEVQVYPGVLHGFLHLTRTVAKARAAIGDGARTLRDAFG
ncbi:MAG: alpha/beta hydrolase fold domain-containing protein [Pseudomonadota bacterium]